MGDGVGDRERKKTEYHRAEGDRGDGCTASIHSCLNVHLRFMHACIYGVCMCTCMYVLTYVVCMYACMYIQTGAVSARECVCVCVCARARVCVCVCVECTHTHVHPSKTHTHQTHTRERELGPAAMTAHW